VIDVGTAEGGLPVHIARAHPHTTGGGFDLPTVRPVFEDYVHGKELTLDVRVIFQISPIRICLSFQCAIWIPVVVRCGNSDTPN
jgi:hypothetical protein